MSVSLSPRKEFTKIPFHNLLLPLVAILIANIASAAEEVVIFVHKEAVSVDDFVRIDISGTFERSGEIEILIAGKDVIWLCKNESPSKSILEGCGKTSWLVKIPKEWESGEYLVKVNIHSGSTSEFSKVLKIVKPRITKIEIPEFVYQGKNKIKVSAELAEYSKAKIGYRIMGNNVDEKDEEFFDFNKDGVSEFYVDLRSFGILKTGLYLLELKLYYNGTLFDSRSATFEIVDPKISLSFKEEITVGETLRIEISTNRKNDTGYSGIFVALVGKNYKATKFVELDEDGKAKAVFETAGLSEGEYRVYARDTGLTLKNIDPKIFAKTHYDLDPSSSYAKLLQADDDVVISKTLRILKGNATKTSVSIYFEPEKIEMQCNSAAKTGIFLIGSKGLSSYDMKVSVENEGVAEINGLTIPNGTHEDYRYFYAKNARFKVFNFRSDEFKKFQLAEIEIKGVSEGETSLKIESAKINDESGNELHPVFFDAKIIVKCNGSGEAEKQPTISENGTQADQKIEEPKSEEIHENAKEERKAETEKILREIPRPKKVQMRGYDFLAILIGAAAFIAVIMKASPFRVMKRA
ncbi:MAG: hypothetical protein LM574_04500 [Archaeoglobus sp.]|nr:hypothetical protein [Archaeoglobus sp.]